MKLTRFQIAKKDIVKYFDGQPEKIFTYKDISSILTFKRDFWRLPVRMSIQEFISTLTEKTILKQVTFSFPSNNITRYTWNNISEYQLVASIKSGAYFTHYTAIFLHNLTDQIPKSIYLNFEQSRKPRLKNKLLQQNINRAFSSSQRTTNNFTTFRNYKIYLLNGSFTNKLGVEDLDTKTQGILPVTNIERTLIDITVRPAYSGGIYEVMNAYKEAAGKVSVNKLVAYLKKLNFVYPYYQAIGFYLEKAGIYNKKQIELLQSFNFKYDFYLTHQIKEKEYSRKWRIFYPKGF